MQLNSVTSGLVDSQWLNLLEGPPSQFYGSVFVTAATPKSTRVFLLEVQRAFFSRRQTWIDTPLLGAGETVDALSGLSALPVASNSETGLFTRRIFRLLSLCRTSPMELFQRQIEAKQYDLATYTAKTFALNRDPLLQRQWLECTVHYPLLPLPCYSFYHPS